MPVQWAAWWPLQSRALALTPKLCTRDLLWERVFAGVMKLKISSALLWI